MRFAAGFLFLMTCIVGCGSPAEQHAQDGIDALDRCDLRSAHASFSEAHSLDASHADIALAYALTDIATLVEDPAFTAIAPRVGFDRPLDSSLLWGMGGLLDRLSRGDSCDAFTPWFRDSFPHRSARSGGPDFWSTVDETLTLGEVRDVLVALSPRLTRVARALETAATGMSEGGVTLSGGCGLSANPTRVQAPELLVLATALDAVVAVVQIARGYDGSIPFRLLFGGSYMREEAWVSAMNAGFFKPTDAAAVAAGRPMLRAAVDLGLRAIAAARTARSATRPSDSVFDWTAVPLDVLDDTTAFGTAISAGLGADGPQPIPRLTPSLSLDLGSFIVPPFDGTAEGPIWNVERADYVWITTNSEALENLLAPHFSENPFRTGAPSYRWELDWSDTTSSTWEQLFDPGDRWSSSYRCTSSSP